MTSTIHTNSFVGHVRKHSVDCMGILHGSGVCAICKRSQRKKDGVVEDGCTVLTRCGVAAGQPKSIKEGDRKVLFYTKQLGG